MLLIYFIPVCYSYNLMPATKLNVGHQIRRAHTTAKDIVYTPRPLALQCIALMEMDTTKKVLDPFRGTGNFFDQFPEGQPRAWCEISKGRDFFQWEEECTYICSNPPYSMMDAVLRHSSSLQGVEKIGYLVGMHSVTPRRLEMMTRQGFALVKMHLCKVNEWWGISVFCVWEQVGSEEEARRRSVVGFDRVYWRAVEK